MSFYESHERRPSIGGSGKSDVYAYYPYFETVTDVNSQYFELATDQTGEGYELSDFLWAKALGSSASVSLSFDSSKRGINFAGAYGDSECIWYPNSGLRNISDGGLNNVASNGYYWSCSPHESSSSHAYLLNFNRSGNVTPSYYDARAYVHSVRCLQVID